MPKRAELTIDKRTVDDLAVWDEEAVFWDRNVPGFGVKVYPSGSKIYTAQTCSPNGIRRMSLGRHGDPAPEPKAQRLMLA